MEIAYLISGVVSLFALIKFFMMCSDVTNIKRILFTDDTSRTIQKYKMEKAFGDSVKAKQYLKEVIWNEIIKVNRSTNDNNQQLKEYERLKEYFKDALDEVNLKFPDNNLASKA